LPASVTCERPIAPEVAGDTIYGVHETEDIETVREHARCGGLPADLVVEVAQVIDPLTGRS